MYAIKTLAIELMTSLELYRVYFDEFYRRERLYHGVFYHKNDIPLLEQSSNSSADSSVRVAQEKRALNMQPFDVTNSSTILLAIPGLNDDEYRIEFKYGKRQISMTGLFSAMLELMMTLAQRTDDDDIIESVSQATSSDLSWIYAMHISESDVPLQVFQLVAILESMARNAVSRRLYVATIFRFYVNRQLVSWGCITPPTASSAWCRDWREGAQEPLMRNMSSLPESDIIQT